MCRYGIPIYGYTLPNYTDGGAEPFTEDVGTEYGVLGDIFIHLENQHPAYSACLATTWPIGKCGGNAPSRSEIKAMV